MEQLVTEASNISEDAAQLMKFHGSYQQDNRDKRTGGKGKAYQFMMRTKQPGGLVSNQLYLTMDDLADQVRPLAVSVMLRTPCLCTCTCSHSQAPAWACNSRLGSNAQALLVCSLESHFK